MDHLDHGRRTTPSHQPTAGVRMLREEIENIGRCGFPNSELISLRQIPSGKSFNNRIYFLNLRHPTDQTSSGTEERPEQKVVLKVNGRFFGSNKIQNEVACLQLLQKHCPSVPTPRVLAWSEDGQAATFATPYKIASHPLDIPSGLDKLDHGGWILMTELTGSPCVTTGLGDATIMDLGRQLADIVSCWRHYIPAQKHCGNIRLPYHESDGGNIPQVDSSALTIQGILQAGIDVTEPITNINDYYRIRLAKKLWVLESSDTYARNRSLAEPIRAFMHDILPQLELASCTGMTDEEYIFTHKDLSPRNVLISGQPPQITGIVDFEFGGFFPPIEEFLNDFISNKGDWPQAFYNSYLDHLEKNGITTPKSLNPNVWNRNYRLETLTARVAPWELPGCYEGKGLGTKLDRAESDARDMLQKLSHPEKLQEQHIQYGEDVASSP
ncbi:hypothetical protein LCI18_003768 [Fusarium solani-melongenae]|uniref:Uncharacterized protein n=1 Tax=Fusarium solani subsp. cucurbitae TaxID=2747967 RepID=A0ACD3YVG2_FUSSC|nr:hypothetical protein LCI18_003768 [Fusarium solani-melongenae]